MNPKVLFILKFRESSGSSYNNCWSEQDKATVGERKELSSGLLNSARFIVNMLEKDGIDVKLVQVSDNNDIDREVTKHRPTHVVIEALWVVPEKFEVLTLLHPRVKWNVRIHSKTPFLANEGQAIDWIFRYLNAGPNVSVSGNSFEFINEFTKLFEQQSERLHYLPNVYTVPELEPVQERTPGTLLRVGCFGAVRPMKNHLQQAVAALLVAKELGMQLEFHINERTEQGGEEVLKNLRALFKATGQTLVLHPWYTHSEFIKVVRQMHLGMQVSMSESFNIITADFVSQNVPIVVSYEMEWMSDWYKANPNDSDDMRIIMYRILTENVPDTAEVSSYECLKQFSRNSLNTWINWLNISLIPSKYSSGYTYRPPHNIA